MEELAMQRKITAVTLAKQPFLRGMSERQLEILAENAMFAEFDPGDLILTQGLPANRFYLLLEGRVDIECPINGETEHIETIVKGDILGWSWLFPPHFWRFQARAATPISAIFFYGDALRERCEDNHDLGYALITRLSRVLTKRLEATRLQLIELRHTINLNSFPKS
jgi:CRP/FNR family transcriptional regulator, cyclic AMP receptor protein